MKFLRKEVKRYINEKVKPLYKTFDKAHNLAHFKFVTSNCVEYASELIKKGYEINLEIAYLVGALHDIGISVEREGHAKHSGEMVRLDKELKSLFKDNEIEIIAQAVEDHSSNLGYEPRNIYGKIVSDADRNNTVYLVFSRPIKYGVEHESHLTREEQIASVFNFVNKKFGRNGYVKYWLDIPQTKKEIQQVWDLLDDEIRCKTYIAGILDEVTKGRLS